LLGGKEFVTQHACKLLVEKTASAFLVISKVFFPCKGSVTGTSTFELFKVSLEICLLLDFLTFTARQPVWVHYFYVTSYVFVSDWPPAEGTGN
jgi:hypothetical protein